MYVCAISLLVISSVRAGISLTSGARNTRAHTSAGWIKRI